MNGEEKITGSVKVINFVDEDGRKIFSVDVGDLSKEKVIEFLNEMMKKHTAGK